MKDRNRIKDILLGVAVGDALGVPYEFANRKSMEINPATEMVGYKVHYQPVGTWSDDSSLTFCLAEAILAGYSLKEAASRFVKWKNEAYWTAHGSLFDIGITTRYAIDRLDQILSLGHEKALENLKYLGSEDENGNGSLMRIAPFLLITNGKTLKDQFFLIWENSSLTHRHIRAAMCCMIYLKLMEHIAKGKKKWEAYDQTREDIKKLWEEIEFNKRERTRFQNVIEFDVSNLTQDEVKSGGYVMESLEASLWCFLTTDTYQQAVLRAVNLGSDTDTTAAITGGLAGLYYTADTIPKNWLTAIARYEEIVELGNQLNEKYNKRC